MTLLRGQSEPKAKITTTHCMRHTSIRHITCIHMACMNLRIKKNKSSKMGHRRHRAIAQHVHTLSRIHSRSILLTLVFTAAGFTKTQVEKSRPVNHTGVFKRFMKQVICCAGCGIHFGEMQIKIKSGMFSWSVQKISFFLNNTCVTVPVKILCK